MSMLAELVDLVIGVDTHADTHTAALIAVDTRAVLAALTVPADPHGYARLVELADTHGGVPGLGDRRRRRLRRRPGPTPQRAR